MPARNRPFFGNSANRARKHPLTHRCLAGEVANSGGYGPFSARPPWMPAVSMPGAALRADSLESFNIKELAVAEGAGFEPAVHLSTYDGLANRWFQPLTHPSAAGHGHFAG